MLPPDTLPVALTTPAVVKLPPVTLPVATIRPAVPKLPTLALPVAFNVPDIFAPVPVTTIVVLPADVRLMLPFTVGIVTLDVPLETPDVLIVANDSPPEPFV